MVESGGSGDSGARDEHRSSDDVSATIDGSLGKIGARLTPPGIRQRYAAKFALSLGVAILLISAVGIGSYVQTADQIRATADEDLRTQTTLNADAVSEWTTRMTAQVRTISTAPTFDTGDPGDISHYLQAMETGASTDVVALHYVTTSGADVRLVASSEPIESSLETDRIDSTWAPIANTTGSRTGLGTVTMTRLPAESRDDSAVLFASPVSGGGVLLLESRMEESMVEADSQSTVQTTLVLDDTGTPILATEQVESANYADRPAFERARGGTTSVVKTPNRVVVFTPIEDTSMAMVTVAQKSTLYQESRLVTQAMLLLVGTTLLSLGVVGIVLGRQTVVPLVALRKRIEEMERGNLDIALKTARTDEIGRLFDAFGNMRDALKGQIREAHEAKEEAERSERELERQNSRLDQFASTLSHDLRNPLAVARGHTELLTVRLEELESTDVDTEPLLEHLEKVEHSHDRIDSIIQDVLTLTREGESVDETEQVSLEDAVEAAWSNVDTRAASIAVLEDRTIEADRTRLLRMIENLFRNAIDHVGDDVAITVGVTRYGFYVADNGPGIPTEEVDHLFEYGYTTSDDGTGIGLSIVKTIAEAHGWRPYVDTTYEDGAMFVFTDVFTDDKPDWHDTDFEWVEPIQDQ